MILTNPTTEYRILQYPVSLHQESCTECLSKVDRRKYKRYVFRFNVNYSVIQKDALGNNLVKEHEINGTTVSVPIRKIRLLTGRIVWNDTDSKTVKAKIREMIHFNQLEFCEIIHDSYL